MTTPNVQSEVLAQIDYTINAYGDFECDELRIARALKVAVEKCSEELLTEIAKEML